MKTKNKILFILFLIIISFFIISNNSYASDSYPYSFTLGNGVDVYLTQDFVDELNCTSFLVYTSQNNRFDVYFINNTDYPNISFNTTTNSSGSVIRYVIGYNSDYSDYISLKYYSFERYATDEDSDGVEIFDSSSLPSEFTLWNTSLVVSGTTESDYMTSFFTNNLICSSNEVRYPKNEELVFREASRRSGGTDNNGDGSGTSDNNSSDSENDSSGWLSNILNAIVNIFDAIGNLASNIASAIASVFTGLFEGVANLVDYILPNPLEENDKWFVTDFIGLLGDLLKGLFIPEDNYFSDKFNNLKDDLNDKIPLYTYLNSLEEIEDAGNTSNGDIAVSVDLENYNLLDKAKLTIQNFIDFSILNKYKDTWFSWVRVFTYVALVIYHINEIIKFLRGFNIVNGSGKEPTPVGTGFYMSDGSRNPNFKGFGKGD